MAYSVIEQEFESYCHSIHPDINPNMFFKEYNDYEQCIPLLRELFTALHQYVHDQLPNIDMSFTARLKSKKSFLDKKILKISEKLSVIFSEGKYDLQEQVEEIDSALNFLPAEKFRKIKQQILACSSSGITTLKNFRFIFDDLTDEEKNLFIKKISRTSDTFAYSFIIKNISYPIKDFKMLDDGTFAIIEDLADNPSEEKIHKIQPAIKFNPETDIVEKSSASKFVSVNGKEYTFNPEYLAYSPLVPSTKRDMNSALKDSNGMLTLLQDTIVLSNGQAFPVENIFFDDSTNSYLLTTPEGERINLTSRLATDKLTLKKFDEETCENAILTALRPALQLFNTENNFRILTEKDFINDPKLDEKTGEPNYKALHNCLFNLTFKYKIEGQLRTFLANILYNFDHDMYKRQNTESQKINPILSEIYVANPDALDSSTPTLMKLLENNLDIDILDLMATYFVTTSFPDGHSDTYLVEPKTAFSHIFGKYAETPSEEDSSKKPKLDFSSYANFIASRAHLKNQLAMPNSDSIDDEEIEL